MDALDELAELINASNDCDSIGSKSTTKEDDKRLSHEEKIVIEHEKVLVSISVCEKKLGFKIDEMQVSGTEFRRLFDDMNYYSPCELHKMRGEDVRRTLMGSKEHVVAGVGCIGVISKCSKSLTNRNGVAYCVLDLVTNFGLRENPVVSILLWRDAYSKFCAVVEMGDVVLVRNEPKICIVEKGKMEISLHASSETQIVPIGKCRVKCSKRLCRSKQKSKGRQVFGKGMEYSQSKPSKQCRSKPSKQSQVLGKSMEYKCQRKQSKQLQELKFHAFNINREKSMSQVFDFDVSAENNLS